MPSPAPLALQKLDGLDRSLPEFYKQLDSILHGDEYRKLVLNLQGDDLVWLVEHLDSVRRHFALLPLYLRQHRLSVSLIPPVLPPESANTNSKPSAVAVGYSQNHTPFHLTVYTLAAKRSPLEAMETCIRGPSVTCGVAQRP